MAQDTPILSGSSPLFLDDYVQALVRLAAGQLPDDPTTRTLLQEATIARVELDLVEAGAPEVLYSGFPWEPHRVDSSLSDSCVVALALGAILQSRHRLRYWEPMLEMGLSGRFKGHLGTLIESRDMLRAVSRLLVDRPLLTRKAGGLQRRLARTLTQIMRWIPDPEVVASRPQADEELDEEFEEDEEDTDELLLSPAADDADSSQPPSVPAPPAVVPARPPPVEDVSTTAPTELSISPVHMSPLLKLELAVGALLAVALMLVILFKFVI